MTFSTRIKQLRSEKKLTAKALASFVGLSTNIVYEWEHGRSIPGIETLCLLSRFFEVSVDYLIGNEDDFGNIVVSGQSTDQLPNDEQRLLQAYRKLDKLDKEKLIDDAEYFANRSTQEKIRKGV